ncbi:MAG TPA: hypothetical protein VFR40_14635 [Lapillicoccus sp.]|nr:hypothetical protein [Lapillicoccus sp.]
MTAGDEARNEPPSASSAPRIPMPDEAQRVPPASAGPTEPPAEVVEVETQLLTRSAIRAAEARRLAAEAEERRKASLAEEAGMPFGVRLVAAASTVALAVLVGLSALVGPNATALAVVFGAIVLAWGWVRLTDAPSPRVAALVLAGSAIVIGGAATLTRTDPYLVWVPVAVAVSIVAVFLHQVLRRGGRPRLTEGVAASAGALALMASGAAIIPVPYYPHGGPWVLVCVLAVAAAALPAVLLGRVAGGWVLLASVVLGGVAAAVTAMVVTGVPMTGSALAGLLVAGISHSMTRVLLALPGARSAQASLAVGPAAVLTVGVVIYLLARIVVG